jgi:hypothetical protein
MQAAATTVKKKIEILPLIPRFLRSRPDHLYAARKAKKRQTAPNFRLDPSGSIDSTPDASRRGAPFLTRAGAGCQMKP